MKETSEPMGKRGDGSSLS